MKCKKVEMNKIASPIISNKEIELFKYIIQDFKNRKNSNINYHTNESDIETTYNKRKKDLLSKYKEKSAKEEEEESNEINKIKKNEAERYKKYFNEFKSISYSLIEEIASSLHILEEEEENIRDKNNINCVKVKCESFDNFFNEIDNIKEKYKNELKKIKQNYKTTEELINQVKEKYEKIKCDSKQKYDTDLNEIIEEFKNKIENYKKEIQKIKNNYQNQIKFGEIIFNAYSQCKFNYFNAKNIYNLMTNYYRNENIYKNIILKYLNNRNDMGLSSLIKQKAKATFENFVGNNKNIFNLKNINSPPCIGLKNINSYCFMNSILQCFSNITKFFVFFKNNNQVLEVIDRNKNKNKNNNHLILSNSFKYLIDNLWPSARDFTKNKSNLNNDSNKVFCPYNIKEKIQKMSEQLYPRKINTPKDLIIFIILTLHEELNKNISLNSIILEPNNQVDETNEYIMKAKFMNTFVRENQSLISDLFYAMQEIIFHCNNCKTIKYNFKKYFYLDFQLNSILKFKKENKSFAPNDSPFENLITIYDCFNYEIKERKTSTKIYCNICRNLAPSQYKINLCFAPEIMIIFINRIEGFKSKIKFQFYEQINLGNYIKIKECGFLYNLIGVVATDDNYLMEKHYFDFCKSPIDSKWYKYDNEKVSLVINTNQEILNNNVPYILFYQKYTM